tara:strand:+ start:4854 stop:5069 length:216 start_codon:yes stop_codon:yes gene_type:complete
MNEEQVTALLQIYQERINSMTAQNIALEATVKVLNNRLLAQQQLQQPPQGEFESASVPEPTPTKTRTPRKK